MRLSLLAVDTHGYTNPGMTIAKLLGFDLCPRLRNLTERKLFLPRDLEAPEGLDQVLVRDVSLKAIHKEWDELLRLAASIRSGHVSANVALHRFGSAAQGDPVHRAAVQQRDGANAYFAYINKNGGVNGRQIEWLVRNDSYNPQEAVSVARGLIDRDGILAFVSTLGTSTNLAVLPLVEQKKVPLIGPVGSSVKLLEPTSRYVFGIAPAGHRIGEEIGKYVLADLKATRIAVLYQNDDFGKDAYEGLVKVIGDKLIAKTTFEPNDIDLSGQVARLQDAKPEVVVLLGIPKPVALFMKTAEQRGWAPKWVGHPLLTEPVFLQLGGSAIEGLDVLLIGTLPDQPEAKEANDILAAYAPNTRPGYFAYEGMIGAIVFVQALKRISGAITVETLIQALEQTKDFDSGIFPKITYAKGDHTGPTKFGVATWKGGKLKVIKGW